MAGPQHSTSTRSDRAAGIALRRAGGSDLPFLASLAAHPEVEPYLAPGSAEVEALSEVLERMRTGEEPHGLMIIERVAGKAVEPSGGEPVGALELALLASHSSLCQLRRLMVAPAARSRGVGAAAVRLACAQAFEDHGLHRIQAEVYGDNEPSQRLFERVGFVREGVRRRAYWRRGRWLDGVLFGLLADDFDSRGVGRSQAATRRSAR